MKIICDRCGKQYNGDEDTIIRRVWMKRGDENENHICSDCNEDLSDWLDEKKVKEK